MVGKKRRCEENSPLTHHSIAFMNAALRSVTTEITGYVAEITGVLNGALKAA
jgi:hypothetical protein